MKDEKYRITVRAIIYQDEKILAVKHKDKATGKVTDYWATPGGGLDYNEPLKVGLAREMLEELGTKAEVGRLLLCTQWFNYQTNMQHIEFFFLIHNSEDFLLANFEGTTHGADEISESGFVDPKQTRFLPEILSELDLKDICENVREVQTISYL